MGCRCGQNRRNQPAGAATYNPPPAPPQGAQMRGMPAGVTVDAVDAVGVSAAQEWFRVDVPKADGDTDSVWWSTQEDALAFAASAGGRTTRTRTPPPSYIAG